MKYNGGLFASTPKGLSQNLAPSENHIKLIGIQNKQLREEYKTDCLDAQQLQKIFNVGQSNVYEWLKKCPVVRQIGRRKVVPTIWLACYLVTGQMK